jgi:cell division protein FtsI (penicillin-binding protein 3)
VLTLEKATARRLYLLMVVMALWGGGIGVRLWMLQVVQADWYRKGADDWQQRKVSLPPARGTIFDSEMNELALSRKVEAQVYASPRKVEKPEETARVLSRILKAPPQTLLKKLKADKVEVALDLRVTESERTALKKANLPGIFFKHEYQRYYPNQFLAAHVLGYVGAEEVGRGGLELRYDDVLKGRQGEATLTVDAHGVAFQLTEKPPEAGADLITTIDRRVQWIIEEELRKAAEQTRARGIQIAAQDPHTGAILGLANYPAFNPNDYDQVSAAARVNSSIAMSYEPGSTFKIVAAAAALEEGLTNPDEMIFCENGSIVLFGHRINDHKPFGMLSVRQIMQQSSDVGIIKLALRVGNEKFGEYITRLGFGRNTGIDLPGEQVGIHRPVSTWTKHSIGSKSMGQEIATTPLQILNMVSMVANGGTLYRPYIVGEIRDPLKGVTRVKPVGERVLSSKTVAQLQGMLEEVVTEGTARSSRLEGYRAAGKTGTAQIYDAKLKRYSDTDYVASFVGFAPISRPEIAMIVVVDAPRGRYHGGDVAAPIFKRIAERILQLRSVPSDVPDYAPTYIATPEKKRKPADPITEPSMGWKAVDAGLTLPEGGAYEAGSLLVPNLVGQNLREIRALGERAGLKVLAVGDGRAIAQHPPAGARVAPGTEVKVRLSLQ